MRSRIARVDSHGFKDRSSARVYFFRSGFPRLYLSALNTYIHELIVRAGGENLAAGHVPVSEVFPGAGPGSLA